MSFLSSVWNLIKKIISKVFGWLKKLLKNFWWVFLIVAAIYFAPAITTWLTANAAPEFLITAFSSLSSVTPYAAPLIDWLWSGGKSLLSGAWSAYSGLGLGQQAAIALGASALLAPEETAAVIEETVDLVGDVVEAGVDAIGSAFSSSPLLMIAAAGLGLWLLFGRDSDDTKVIISPVTPLPVGGTNG